MFQAPHKKPRGFTKKPAARAETEDKISLGDRHNSRIKEFESVSSKLAAKEKELAGVIKQIEEITSSTKRSWKSPSSRLNQKQMRWHTC